MGIYCDSKVSVSTNNHGAIIDKKLTYCVLK